MRRLDDFKEIVDANLEKLDLPQDAKLRLKEKVRTTTKPKAIVSINMTRAKWLSFIGIPAVAAVLAFIVFFTGIFSGGKASKVYASDLMKGIKPNKVELKDLSHEFIQSTADFSIDLFKQSYGENKGKNTLVSPTSVYLALGMCANGADGNTLKEFEALLGKKGLNLKDLNSYYNSLAKDLITKDNGKVSIANSIWYKDDESLVVNRDFLQTNADYYKAQAYKADFNSSQTVKDINNWVENNTGKLIDKIIDRIGPRDLMYLINAVYFEDEWETSYNKEAVHSGRFKLSEGTEKSVDFMSSEEHVYLKDDKAEGFIKPYKNGKYSFVALLPNEGVNIDSYISSLSGENFAALLRKKTDVNVRASLPKFEAKYEIRLAEPLKRMGLKECFDQSKANFTKMATSKTGNIYVDDVLHKTFITVDAKGTKAAAVTAVIMKGNGSASPHIINLNRPFIYAIVDNKTQLPLFFGVMMNPEI